MAEHGAKQELGEILLGDVTSNWERDLPEQRDTSGLGGGSLNLMSMRIRDLEKEIRAQEEHLRKTMAGFGPMQMDCSAGSIRRSSDCSAGLGEKLTKAESAKANASNMQQRSEYSGSPTVLPTLETPKTEAHNNYFGNNEEVPQLRGRPNITPDRFDGKSSWVDYRKHFEACVVANGWTEAQAAVFLAASLKGAALKVLGRCNQEGGQTAPKYQEILKLLGAQFGPGQMAENYLMELRMRRQGPNESLRELGQAITELVTLAYPEFDESGRDRLARAHFADAIEKQSIREGIFRARPQKLHEAIRAALATENFERMEAQREGIPRRVKFCRISGANEGETGRQTGPTPANNFQREPRFGSVPREMLAQEDIICFKCGGRGHFARRCPSPSYSKMNRQSENDWRSTSLGPGGRPQFLGAGPEAQGTRQTMGNRI